MPKISISHRFSLMTALVVLDASAALAYLLYEPGGEGRHRTSEKSGGGASSQITFRGAFPARRCNRGNGHIRCKPSSRPIPWRLHLPRARPLKLNADVSDMRPHLGQPRYRLPRQRHQHSGVVTALLSAGRSITAGRLNENRAPRPSDVIVFVQHRRRQSPARQSPPGSHAVTVSSRLWHSGFPSTRNSLHQPRQIFEHCRRLATAGAAPAGSGVQGTVNLILAALLPIVPQSYRFSSWRNYSDGSLLDC